MLLQPRPFILTGLPYKRDDHQRQVSRTARTGRRSSLTITYIATDDRFPLPFGADRSLLAWITTKACLDGSVTFTAISEYFRAFGLDQGGRAYRLFRERFQRIANLAFRLEEREAGRRSVRRLFLVPESREPIGLLEGPPEALPGQLLAYQRYGFRLDGGFWTYLQEGLVPTPVEVLRAFHDCPRGWDFVQLVLYRCFVAKTASVLTWPELVAQLGTRDRDPYRLKFRLGEALDTLRSLYPDCPVHFRRGLGGLLILPWRPGQRPPG